MSVQLNGHRAKVEVVKIPQLKGTLRAIQSDTGHDPVRAGGIVE